MKVKNNQTDMRILVVHRNARCFVISSATLEWEHQRAVLMNSLWERNPKIYFKKITYSHFFFQKKSNSFGLFLTYFSLSSDKISRWLVL